MLFHTVSSIPPARQSHDRGVKLHWKHECKNFIIFGLRSAHPPDQPSSSPACSSACRGSWLFPPPLSDERSSHQFCPPAAFFPAGQNERVFFCWAAIKNDNVMWKINVITKKNIHIGRRKKFNDIIMQSIAILKLNGKKEKTYVIWNEKLLWLKESSSLFKHKSTRK